MVFCIAKNITFCYNNIMRKIEVKSLIGNKFHFNLYRGCTHGCIYCDSRSLCY